MLFVLFCKIYVKKRQRKHKKVDEMYYKKLPTFRLEISKLILQLCEKGFFKFFAQHILHQIALSNKLAPLNRNPHVHAPLTTCSDKILYTYCFLNFSEVV